MAPFANYTAGTHATAIPSDLEPDDRWKINMRKQIEQNLSSMVQGAKQVLNDRRSNPALDQSTVWNEYNATMTEIRAIAEQHYRHALERERKERLWACHELEAITEQQEILDSINRGDNQPQPRMSTSDGAIPSEPHGRSPTSTRVAQGGNTTVVDQAVPEHLRSRSVGDHGVTHIGRFIAQQHRNDDLIRHRPSSAGPKPEIWKPAVASQEASTSRTLAHASGTFSTKIKQDSSGTGINATRVTPINLRHNSTDEQRQSSSRSNPHYWLPPSQATEPVPVKRSFCEEDPDRWDVRGPLIEENRSGPPGSSSRQEVTESWKRPSIRSHTPVSPVRLKTAPIAIPPAETYTEDDEFESGDYREFPEELSRRENREKMMADTRKKEEDLKRIREEIQRKEEGFRQKEEEVKLKQEEVRLMELEFMQEAEAKKIQLEALKKEEDIRQKELMAMRKAEERRQGEEARWEDQEYIMIQETEAKRVDDEIRKREVEALRKEEEALRKEEEIGRGEEEVRRIEREAQKKQEEMKRKEGEASRKEEEARRQAEAVKRKEAEARKREQEIKKKEEQLKQRENGLKLREVEVRSKEERREEKEEVRRARQGSTSSDTAFFMSMKKEEELKQKEEELEKREADLQQREAGVKLEETETKKYQLEAEAKLRGEEETKKRELGVERQNAAMLEADRLEVIRIEAEWRMEKRREQKIELERHKAEADVQRAEEARKREAKFKEDQRRAEEIQRQRAASTRPFGVPIPPSAISPSQVASTSPKPSSLPTGSQPSTSWTSSSSRPTSAAKFHASNASRQTTTPTSFSRATGTSWPTGGVRGSAAGSTSYQNNPNPEAEFWARRQAEYAQKQQEQFRQEQKRKAGEKQAEETAMGKEEGWERDMRTREADMRQREAEVQSKEREINKREEQLKRRETDLILKEAEVESKMEEMEVERQKAAQLEADRLAAIRVETEWRKEETGFHGEESVMKRPASSNRRHPLGPYHWN